MGLLSRSESATHFPRVSGQRLDGTDVSFPEDLPADATLLVVAFRDDLDPLADQWARLGDRIAEVHGERIATVETPVVNKKLKLLGGLATMGIRSQVHGADEQARTVPIFVDVKAFRKELELDTGDVYAFLLARDGRIAWRGEGEIDVDEVEALEAAVREVLDAPTPSIHDHPELRDQPSQEATVPHNAAAEADAAPETESDPATEAADAEAGAAPRADAPADTTFADPPPVQPPRAG